MFPTATKVSLFHLLMDSVKCLESAQDTPRPTSQHRDLFAPERQKARNKKEREEKRDRGWRRDICPRSTKVCLWIESRQRWPIAK